MSILAHGIVKEDCRLLCIWLKTAADCKLSPVIAAVARSRLARSRLHLGIMLVGT